jgi:hypothetical protein
VVRDSPEGADGRAPTLEELVIGYLASARPGAWLLPPSDAGEEAVA